MNNRPFQYIEAPDYEEVKNENSVFLAGGITNCENWQLHTVEFLKSTPNLTVVNPRPTAWQGRQINWVTQSEEQIKWEYHYLRDTSSVLFWFTDETIQPIVLFELGATLERLQQGRKIQKEQGYQHPGLYVPGKSWSVKFVQRIYLGVHPNYSRKMDVEIQAKCAGFPWIIYSELDTMLTEIRDRQLKENEVRINSIAIA